MDIYLITGGDGFIGSHLAERLLSGGARIRILDNLFARGGANIEFLKSIPDGSLEIFEDDVRDPEACARACQGATYVLHQAGLGSVPRSVADPLTTHQVNATGGLNMLWAAQKAGVKRFVWSSSSSVYGDQEGDFKTETMKPKPISPYAVSKAAAEQYASVFFLTYGLPTVSLRYFNVFGPRQSPEGDYAAVIPKFIGLMMDGQRPVIYGEGIQSRDFTYVGNVVDGNLAALTAPQAPGRTINLADGSGHDLLDLVAKLNVILDTDLEPILAEPRPGDILHSKADNSLARELLGYEGRVGYEEGLELTVKSFRD